MYKSQWHYRVTGFVASAFNSIRGVTDIEGWWDNSNNFYQQSLIWGCALACRLVPSLCLPSSPSLTAPVDHASHHRKCKVFLHNDKVTALYEEGQPPLAATPRSSSDAVLGDKWESQKLGVQISCSPLMPMLHFHWQPRNEEQTDVLGDAKAISAAYLRFWGFSGLHCCWSPLFKRGELVGWQQT